MNESVIVSNILHKKLEPLPMKYPVASGESSAELQGFREMLLGER